MFSAIKSLSVEITLLLKYIIYEYYIFPYHNNLYIYYYIFFKIENH